MIIEYTRDTEEFLSGTPQDGWGIHKTEGAYFYTVVRNNEFVVVGAGGFVTIEEAIKEASKAFDLTF